MFHKGDNKYYAQIADKMTWIDELMKATTPLSIVFQNPGEIDNPFRIKIMRFGAAKHGCFLYWQVRHFQDLYLTDVDDKVEEQSTGEEAVIQQLLMTRLRNSLPVKKLSLQLPLGRC